MFRTWLSNLIFWNPRLLWNVQDCLYYYLLLFFQKLIFRVKIYFKVMGITPRERKWQDNCECRTSNGTCDVVHWTIGHLRYWLFNYSLNKRCFLTRKNPAYACYGYRRLSYICELLSGCIEILFHRPCSVNLNSNHLYINKGWLIFEL